MLCLMSDIAPKVLPHNNVPSSSIAPVEFAFNVRGNVLLDVELFDRGNRNFDRALLHLFRHIHILDDRSSPGVLGGLFS